MRHQVRARPPSIQEKLRKEDEEKAASSPSKAPINTRTGINPGRLRNKGYTGVLKKRKKFFLRSRHKMVSPRAIYLQGSPWVMEGFPWRLDCLVQNCLLTCILCKLHPLPRLPPAIRRSLPPLSSPLLPPPPPPPPPLLLTFIHLLLRLTLNRSIWAEWRLWADLLPLYRLGEAGPRPSCQVGPAQHSHTLGLGGIGGRHRGWGEGVSPGDWFSSRATKLHSFSQHDPNWNNVK